MFVKYNKNLYIVVWWDQTNFINMRRLLLNIRVVTKNVILIWLSSASGIKVKYALH